MQAVKKFKKVEVWIPSFLTSVLDEGDWSASSPGRFTKRRYSTGTRIVGGWSEPAWTLPRGETYIVCPGNGTTVSARCLVTVLSEPSHMCFWY